MAKSQQTFSKSEKEKKRLKKRQEKEAKKLARKEEEKNSGLDSMMAYVDEFGNITDTPPDPTKKKKEGLWTEEEKAKTKKEFKDLIQKSEELFEDIKEN